MNGWYDRLRFLWEEEPAPAGGAPRLYHQTPTGVPRPLLKATRFAFIGLVATTLMGQIIGVRLVAPVDAAPNYQAKCDRRCNEAFQDCQKKCKPGAQGQSCRDSCQNTHRLCLQSCDTGG
jgi:hypothetical protein